MKTKIQWFLFLIIATMLPLTAYANTATIEKVLRGDRLQIKGWEVVRLSGIIAPALDEPFGEEAYQLAKQELEGKLVRMATYTTDNTAVGIVRDPEGLCLVQIEYGDTALSDKKAAIDFGASLLDKGLARVDERYLPDYLQHYREIEKTAKEKKIGIWKDLKDE
ncbi:MAG: thermonuclease family protein [Calditrichota bacterium]